MTTLTATYCKFCEVIANFYNSFKDLFTSKMDKKAFKELSALSDRELNDIGISRSEIRAIATNIHKPYRK